MATSGNSVNQLNLGSAVMAFKCLTSRVPFLSIQKREEMSRCTTRSSQTLNIPVFKTASGQRTFYYTIASIWNPMEIYFRTFRSVIPQNCIADPYCARARAHTQHIQNAGFS